MSRSRCVFTSATSTTREGITSVGVIAYATEVGLDGAGRVGPGPAEVMATLCASEQLPRSKLQRAERRVQQAGVGGLAAGRNREEAAAAFD